VGAFICFEDEAGQGLMPPKGRTLGIWSLLKRSMANFAATDVDGASPHR
jgi:hypothetical protein